jgi:HlyD family secretion protein
VVDSEDQLQRRDVRLGDSNREFVEVLSGLKVGDRVVVSDMQDYKSSKSLKLKK